LPGDDFSSLLQGAAGGFAGCRKDRAMIIEQRLITPEIAADMLTRNDGNRPLRPRTWQGYAKDMLAGKWRQTHEAIAVTTSGRLINGQHRLTAVVHSGLAQVFWVAIYDSAETAMDLPIDFGARRTISDILKEDKPHVLTANAVFRYAIIRHATTPRPHETQYILRQARSAIADAVAVSRSRERFRGSAMVRAAVVCNLLLDRGSDSISRVCYKGLIESYRAWVAGENARWASVEAFNKQVPSMDRNFTPNTFCRALFAFNAENSGFKVIRISAQQEVEMLDELREKLKPLFPDLFANAKATE